MGPSLLHAFVLCLVGDCGKIVIFAIFAKFAAFANFYGAPFTALCFACFVGDCGKIVIFAIFAKFAAFANFYGAPITALCFASLAIVAKLSFSPYLPNLPTFMGPLHSCFASLAIVAPLSPTFMGPLSLLCALPRWRLWQNCHSPLSPYVCPLHSPLSPTVMGPLHCFVLCLVGDCGKIVIFAIFAKFAAFAPSLLYGQNCPLFAKFAAFANVYVTSLLCVLPPWRLWQNCHFRHIC